VSTANSTTLTLKENVDTLDNHIETLVDACEAEENEWLAEAIQNRISRLTSGISTIYVGGASDVEQVERKERVDDAVNACKLALESGVVVGGGAMLWHSAKQMVSRSEVAELYQSALMTPIETIITNSGSVDRNFSLGKEHYVCGKTGEIRKAKDDGVYDPMQVTINSLESAVSIAALVLMTDAAIIAPTT